MKLPEISPDLDQIFQRLGPSELQSLIQQAAPLPKGRYLHWDELRYREPPEGLSHEM